MNTEQRERLKKLESDLKARLGKVDRNALMLCLLDFPIEQIHEKLKVNKVD